MDISLQSYRQVIGAFQFKGVNKKSVMRKGWKSSSEYKARSKMKISKPILISDIILGILCWSILFLLVNSDLYSNQSRLSYYNEIPQSSFRNHGGLTYVNIHETFELFCRRGGMIYSFESSSNKLMHSLNGNRRNLGYRYFVWNCDRAFLSDNKIEDVKVFVEQRKPHIFSIIEVNINRS